nr:hypothetical protein [uncultured Butyrivibrio sp.]
MSARTCAKSVIKKIVVLFCGKKFSEMKIGPEKVLVSFDIYDTAVRRTVEKPEDVFDLVQEKYCIDNEWRLSQTFREIRSVAEKKARRFSATGEVKLQDIYYFIDNLNEDEKNVLIEIETDVEKQVAYINPEFKTIYERLLTQDLEIVFTSDMYLAEKTIIEILKKTGITEFKKVYVSCEYNASKKNGKLFNHVLNDFGGHERNIVHIGDNAWGDFVIPLSKGISSFLYRAI